LVPDIKSKVEIFLLIKEERVSLIEQMNCFVTS
jgi:hypothetical protein